MAVQRLVAEGERPPWGYGVAWVDFMRDMNVAYPVPLNFVARWFRDLWWWLAKRRRPSVVEGRDCAIWMAARERYDKREVEVMTAAYKQGYESGWWARDRLPYHLLDGAIPNPPETSAPRRNGG